jgi:hypothetical protein
MGTAGATVYYNRGCKTSLFKSDVKFTSAVEYKPHGGKGFIKHRDGVSWYGVNVP